MTDDITSVVPVTQPGMMIKNLHPALTERGKIKIGMKGETRKASSGKSYQLPQKLDHFLVTTLFRDDTGNFKVDKEIMDKLGEKPTTIPIQLLYDDPNLNLQTRYAVYTGRQLWCSGDGETALRLKQGQRAREGVRCICERQDPSYEGQDRCKINGTLSVIIDGVPQIGGVWKFRTTSYNTVVGLMSSLALIRRMTGGILAGIPLQLTLSPKTVTSPADGKVQTVFVVGIEYHGTADELQAIGYDTANKNAIHAVKIETLEQEARKLLAAPADKVFASDDEDDLIDEFYPGQVLEDAPARPKREEFEKEGGEKAAEEPAPKPAQEEPEVFKFLDHYGETQGEGMLATSFATAFREAAESTVLDVELTALIDHNIDEFGRLADVDAETAQVCREIIKTESKRLKEGMDT